MAEHFEKHREENSRRGREPKQIELLSRIRELTKEWHASEEGRAWHKQHAKEIMDKKRKTKVCANCGRTFETCGDSTICKRCYNAKYAREYRRRVKEKSLQHKG